MSDGIHGAINKKAEPLGIEATKNLILSNRDLAPVEMIRKINEGVLKHTSNCQISDDYTVLVIEKT